MKITCDGPGPHDPPDGILGESTRPAAGVRCASPACVPTPDPRGLADLDLRGKLTAAVGANRTYLGLATPTAAQTTAQARSLTRQVIALELLLLGTLDDTSGT